MRLVAGGIPGVAFVDPFVLVDLWVILVGLGAIAVVSVVAALRMGKFDFPGTVV